MNDKRGKVNERILAKILGTERIPLSGGNSKTTRSDTLHEKLFVELKTRRSHSVVSLWRKTKELALKEKKTPLVVLKRNQKAKFLADASPRRCRNNFKRDNK